MQRLEILYKPTLFGMPPLTDTAHYWELNVKVCGDRHYLEAVGYSEGGDAAGEHLVPYELVRSASARPIQAAEETPDVQQ